MEYTLRSIGIIDTPFSQKFAIPRQSQALSLAKGLITFSDDIHPRNACRGIEGFSHLWLSFVFHENMDKGWKDTVRPPRLGGNERVGVFATRSTFRPNPLGLSVVKNLGLNPQGQLLVQGVDLVKGTPIVDIKPYVPYADVINDATSGFTQDKDIPALAVALSPEAQSALLEILNKYPDFKDLMVQVLSQDPRPAYRQQQQDNKDYHVRLYNIDIHWRVHENSILVFAINKVPTAHNK